MLRYGNTEKQDCADTSTIGHFVNWTKMHCNRSGGNIGRPLVAYSGVSKPNLKITPTLRHGSSCSSKQRKGLNLSFFIYFRQ